MKKTLDQMIIEEKRAYAKEWRDKNPDKVKKHRDTYWKKRTLERLKKKEEED